jgi:uncharacterized membrane protein
MPGMDNVVVVRFAEPSKAFEAFSVLKDAAAEGRLEVDAATVVERAEDGALRERDSYQGDVLSATASGSLIGLLVGVLGGPLGLLLGWSAGALIGSSVDLDRAGSNEEALSALAREIPAGRTALVAAVTEPSTDVLDGEMAELGGEVTHRQRAEVLAALEAADEAAAAAAREARRSMREHRVHEAKEEWSARVARLKVRFHRP